MPEADFDAVLIASYCVLFALLPSLRRIAQYWKLLLTPYLLRLIASYSLHQMRRLRSTGSCCRRRTYCV